MSYDAYLQLGADGPDDDDAPCDVCGTVPKYDRIARADVCGCNAGDFFDDNEYIDARDGAAADRMAP